MNKIHPSYLAKNADLEAYKRFASQGMDLMFPVRVKGNTHRPDINIPYHTTIKLFDTSKDTPEQVHEVASKLPLNPPNPKEVNIEPSTLKGRQGNVMHVIKLHGPHAENIKGHHKHFAHLGYPENYEYAPHITVDEATWNHIVNSGAKTAHEAGIEFMPAELHHKDKVVANYKPKMAAPLGGEHQAPDKLNKGIFRDIGTAAAMSAALASPALAPTDSPQYSSKHMLQAIADVESQGGRRLAHAAGGGPIHGSEHAYGKYGLMPQTIRETISMHPDLRMKHRKATMLHGNDLHRYMQDNPGLEDTVAEKHLHRLEHHFGKNPADIGYSWLEGIRGTNKAKKEGKDLNSHWHVRKVKEAYEKRK